MFTQYFCDAITVTWKTHHFHHFTSEQNKVSESEVVEKIIASQSNLRHFFETQYIMCGV